MRARDIKTGVEYAVSVPDLYGSGRGANTVQRCAIEGLSPSQRHVYVRVCDQPERVPCVAIQNVLATWADYRYGLDYNAAIREDTTREWMAEYDRMKSEFAARWEREVLPAFEGICCDPDHRFDTVADVLRDYFITSGSQSVTLRRHDIEQIARRLRYLGA